MFRAYFVPCCDDWRTHRQGSFTTNQVGQPIPDNAILIHEMPLAEARSLDQDSLLALFVMPNPN